MSAQARMGRYEWGAAVSVIATYRDLYGADAKVAEVLDGLTVAMGIVFARDNGAFDGLQFVSACGLRKVGDT